MKTKTFYLTLFFIYYFIQNGYSQNPNKLNGYRILLTPTQAIFNDFPISLERLISRYNLGLTFSYKKSTISGGEIMPVGSIVGGYGYNIYPVRSKFYDGINTELNAKIYEKKRRGFFELVVFRSYFWFDNKNIKYSNVESNSFEGLRTENQTVYGLKIQVGETYNFNFSKRHSFVVEYLAGLGIRYNKLSSTTRFGTINDVYYDIYKENSSYLSPVIHVGLKVGYQILKINH